MEGFFRRPNNYAGILKKYTDRSCVDNYHIYKEEIETKINEFYGNGNGKGNFCQKCYSVRQQIIKRNDDLNFYCKNHPLYDKFIKDNDEINGFMKQCPELNQCLRNPANRVRRPAPPTRPTVGHCKQNGHCNRGAVPTERVVGKAQTGPVIAPSGIRKPGEEESLVKDKNYGEDERTRLAEVVSNSQEGRMHSRSSSSSSMHVGASEPSVGHPSSTFELGPTKTQHLSPLPLSALSALSSGHGGYSAQTSSLGESGAITTSEGKTLEMKTVQSQLVNGQLIKENHPYAQALDGKIVSDLVQVKTDLASREPVNGHLTGIPIIGGVYGEGAHFNPLHQKATGSGDYLGGVPSSRISCSKTTDGINNCSEQQYDGTHSAANRAVVDDTQRTYLRGEHIKALVGQVPSHATSQETQVIGRAADSTYPHIDVAPQLSRSPPYELTDRGVGRTEELAGGKQVHLEVQSQPHMQLYSNKEKILPFAQSLGQLVQTQLEPDGFNGVLSSEVARLLVNPGNGENLKIGEIESNDLGIDVNMITEDPMMAYKKYATMALAPTGVIMLMTILTKFTPLGMFFTKKNRNKRNDMKEKIERLLLSESPVATEENNINFAYSPQYWET
ncbi:VIR protein [Plasmodium vivax]|uniref:VIR protein n=1 Tax=Plasmodium vivax TaxID=5855 RepID=A0A1G4H0N4_PLAVI|nr:VIR protein [Plasmodium vivax]